MRVSLACRMALLLCLAGSTLSAQGAPPAPGDRVRLRVALTAGAGGETQWTGHFLGSDSTMLRLMPAQGDSLLVRRELVRRLEVYAGRKRSTVRGIWMGTLALGLAAGVSAAASDASCTDGYLCLGPGGAFAVGAVMGGTLGAFVGGIVGWNVRHDAWRAAPLPAPRPAPTT